jgi:hypothetical protein
MNRQYTTDDLLHLTKLGRFGSPEMNALAASAFLHLFKLKEENEMLRKRIDENEVKIFHIPNQQDVVDKE